MFERQYPARAPEDVHAQGRGVRRRRGCRTGSDGAGHLRFVQRPTHAVPTRAGIRSAL